MPKQHKVTGLIAATALMAAPAVADGYANRPVNRGPEPLQAHAEPAPPEPGCYLVGPDTWSCPPLPQRVETHTVRERAYSTACCHSRPAPRPARVSYTRQAAPAPRNISVDINGFTGGVGSGVDGGYYGGGGGFAYASASSSASVFASAAASFTFRGGFHGGGKHHGGGGGCNKCGGGHGGHKGGGH